MAKLPPDLRKKFFEFHDAYEFARECLLADGASGSFLAEETWRLALDEVPLTPKELQTYKLMIAMRSVNGGELFADDDENC